MLRRFSPFSRFFRFFGGLTCIMWAIAVAAPESASAALPPKAPIPYKPVTVSELPGSTINQDLPPDERARAENTFQQYRIAASSGTVKFGAGKPSYVKTRDGRQVDAGRLYVFLNDVEQRLNKIGYTLRDPKLTDIDLDQLYGPAVSRPGPLTEQMRFGAARKHTRTMSPATAPTSDARQPTCSTAQPDLSKTWKTLNDLAKGSKVARADLDFGCKLAEAEAKSPVVPGSLQYQTPPFLYGNNYGQAQLQNAVVFKGTDKMSAIEYTSTVTASVLGKTFNVADLDATFTAPTNGDSTATIDLKLGQVSAYHADTTFKTLNLNVVPDQELTVVPPYKASFDVGAGFRANFEVNCKAKYGLNGHAEASPVGLFVESKPHVSLKVTGALSIDGIFVQGGLNGTLTLADFAGDFGGVSAIFADTTAPDTGGSVPIVSVTRPIATYSLNPLSGSIEAYLYPALVHWPRLHRTIPISFGNLKPVSKGLVASDWTVIYVAPGSTPKKPAQSP